MENSASDADYLDAATLAEFDLVFSEPSPQYSTFDCVEHFNTPETVVTPQPLASETVDPKTVAALKASLANGSRLIGTFTVLKSTYLKLCKEFNFLLAKFNENERLKVELIHENNELRRLLWESVNEREVDRRRYRMELQAARAH